MFDEIKGQEKAIRIIKNFILKNRFPHSLLFYGPEGVGKFLTAKSIAKYFNCSNENPDLKGNDNCDNCRKIENGIFPDVFFIEPEKKEIKISQIREIIYKAFLKPIQSKYKFFIINDADTMNQYSENSFLKTLEEPPENNYIILITHNINSMLETIISRCWTIEFNRISPEIIKQIIIEKKPEISEETAETISIISNGSLNKAFKLAESEILNKILETINNTINFFNKKNFDFENFKNVVSLFSEIEQEEVSYIFEFLSGEFIEDYFYYNYKIPKTVNAKNILNFNIENVNLERLNRFINLLKQVRYDLINTNVNFNLLIEKFLIEGREFIR